MTESDIAIVLKCASAMCHMCDEPAKWQAVHREDGDWYHRKVKRFDEAGMWCDSNAIWHEFPEARAA